MNRINQRMQALRQAGRKALVPYIVSGDPNPGVTVPAMHALVKAGADILEIGVPFSDPTAEGPVIQRAHERALANKISLRKTLALVAEFRQQDTDTPVVLMGYTNPIEKMGYDVFVGEAARAGVDGVLTVDLPPEEAVDFNARLKAAEIENIFLIAPTTTEEREKAIAELAGGYIYYVSLKGVTGAGHLDVSSVKQKVAEIRALTDLPVCVGFGIKDGQTARQIAATADGVVVGSVIVDRIAQSAAQQGGDGEVIAAIAEIVAEIRAALDAR